MAARLRRDHDDYTRKRIQTTQIINRLQKFVHGEVEMSSEQVQAAKVLLAKTLPDLKQVEHAGEIAERRVSEAPLSAEEWKAQHSHEGGSVH